MTSMCACDMCGSCGWHELVGCRDGGRGRTVLNDQSGHSASVYSRVADTRIFAVDPNVSKNKPVCMQPAYSIWSACGWILCASSFMGWRKLRRTSHEVRTYQTASANQAGYLKANIQRSSTGHSCACVFSRSDKNALHDSQREQYQRQVSVLADKKY